MTPTLTIITIATYLLILFAIAWWSRCRTNNDNFFTGGRNQSWWIVALAMIGAPMTGITFISVPGAVGVSGFSYLQMVLGFIVGSIVIAHWLIPLYYRHNIVSLYEYLDNRFGVGSHTAGAWLFMLSKVISASLRVFVVCMVIQQLLCASIGIPFAITVIIFILLVYLYTYRGGVVAVVWTDALKTICMVLCVAFSTIFLLHELNLSVEDATHLASTRGLTKLFFLDDFSSPHHFVKMFFSGLFMIIAMTGLDQDMMQRALSSRTQNSAQQNIVLASLLQTVVITMLLALGVLLYLYLAKNGEIIAKPDEAFAFVATHEGMPAIISILLILGVFSASFSSTGGALTALTTSFIVDIIKDKSISTTTRKFIHCAITAIILLLVLAFERWSNNSSINIFYRLASYTYGPLLGMFAFGILSKRKVIDRYMPIVVVITPLLSLLIDYNSEAWFGGYQFGFEILLLNALITISGIYIISRKEHKYKIQ